MDGFVTKAHGAGGKAQAKLLTEVIRKHFIDVELARLGDAAIVPATTERMALTCDNFVVHPRFFPGGEIGKLAACGVINDLAAMGARARYLTVGLIIEEGLSFAELNAHLAGLAQTTRSIGARVVAGDTKVVSRGEADGLFINVAAVGEMHPGLDPGPGPERMKPGDVLLINGGLGEHGMAVMMARAELPIHSELVSDCAPLWDLVEKLLRALGNDVHAMRDPTRGGLASAVVELAEASGVEVELVEGAITIAPAVRSACEILGFDPLQVANEGKMLAVVEGARAEEAVALWREHELGKKAAIIGSVEQAGAGKVWLRTGLGSRRRVDMIAGELLPRIC